MGDQVEQFVLDMFYERTGLRMQLDGTLEPEVVTERVLLFLDDFIDAVRWERQDLERLVERLNDRYYRWLEIFTARRRKELVLKHVPFAKNFGEVYQAWSTPTDYANSDDGITRSFTNKLDAKTADMLLDDVLHAASSKRLLADLLDVVEIRLKASHVVAIVKRHSAAYEGHPPAKLAGVLLAMVKAAPLDVQVSVLQQLQKALKG